MFLRWAMLTINLLVFFFFIFWIVESSLKVGMRIAFEFLAHPLNQRYDIIIMCLFSQVSDVAHGPLVFETMVFLYSFGNVTQMRNVANGPFCLKKGKLSFFVGVQQTKVVCVERDRNLIVTNDNCVPAARPAVQTIQCNTRICPPG